MVRKLDETDLVGISGGSVVPSYKPSAEAPPQSGSPERPGPPGGGQSGGVDTPGGDDGEYQGIGQK
jgi:hypothetical protein